MSFHIACVTALDALHRNGLFICVVTRQRLASVSLGAAFPVNIVSVQSQASWSNGMNQCMMHLASLPFG